MPYVDDDLDAAKAFVSGMNRKLVRSRFSAGSTWTPDHVTLVRNGNGKIVAMVDAIVLGDGAAANAGLLAAPGCGAYAVKALLHMKARLPIDHWESTLRAPTPSTMAISRRHFIQTFDQVASELASKMVEMYGQQHLFHPVPLLASDAFLKMVGLPPLKRWDTQTKLQVLKSAALGGGMALISPSGQTLPMQDVAAIAFDLLETPYDARQQFSRTLISSVVAMHGHDPSPLIGKVLKTGGSSQFLASVQSFAGADTSGGGLFKTERLDPAKLAENFRSVAARFSR